MASIFACPPLPYSRTSVVEPAHIGSVAEQEVLGPVDLQAWELGAVTETGETVSVALEVSDTSGQVGQKMVGEPVGLAHDPAAVVVE